jgi:hypothetical protein
MGRGGEDFRRDGELSLPRLVGVALEVFVGSPTRLGQPRPLAEAAQEQSFTEPGWDSLAAASERAVVCA